MSSMDKWYACPLEVNDEELERLFNMNNELIKKSDILELIDSLNISDRQIYEDLLFNVEDMPPVKAVELPCKVGDTVYEITTNGSEIYSNTVKKIVFDTEGTAFDERAIGISIFLTKEEAEQALKELSNDT